MNEQISTVTNKDRKDVVSLLMLILLASQIVFQGIVIWRLMTLERKLSDLIPSSLQSNADSIVPKLDSTIIQEVSVGLNPPRGDINAPLTIVEFADFSCSFCTESSPILKELIDSNPGKVKLYYRHFLHVDNTYSFQAALAVECASKQGRYWEMNDALFVSAPGFSENRLINIANSLGLDKTSFSTCMSTEEFKVRVQDDVEEAQNLGVSGTPTFFINGRMIVGARSLNEWKTLLNLP